MYELVVIADENDADYQTAINEINEEDLNRFCSLLKKVKERMDHRLAAGEKWNYRHNWENNERGNLQEQYPDWTKDDIEFFNEYLPYSEYGLHTIVNVSYYSKPEKIILLDI